MIHKARFAPFFLLLFNVLAIDAHAQRRSTVVLESSTSGRLVRISFGTNVGLIQNEPVLFSANDKKIAAGRVFRVDESSAIVAILEKYGEENPQPDSDYELLFGEPFDEAANLPDYVVDRDEELDNPGNETFLQRDETPNTPELDDDDYTPEVTLRPKFPEPRTYSAHNLTIGLALFRNFALPTPANPDTEDDEKSTYATYQGYTVRYAYTFRTHYWMRASAPALLSVEGTFGVYNFEHTFHEFDVGGGIVDRVAQVRVIPLGLNLRYMFEVSKLFRLYPYVGYQYNVVSAASGNLRSLNNIQGGHLLGGAGAQLVMSNAIDARLEAGSDGLMAGIVVKF